MKRMIHMQDVSWRREGIEILRDIDWTVKRGEHWTVLGLNGAGKTSLLNMVNGYIWPTTGEVEVLERPFGRTDIHELRKSIGWVSSALGERINGRHPAEEIVISGKFAAMGLVFEEASPEDLRLAEQWMEQLGVEHAIGQAYEKCSQGERQKILIARSLMANPSLLILDEPTNGLDFIAREELLSVIENLGKQENAPTIIFVTHHIEEILPIFSHTILIKDGTVFAKGDRQSILQSETLSTMYDKNLQITWRNNRPWMSLE
ncbi:MAG TPA: ABC transporter ATP-binding protein [Pseudogracilibacillus sp.]|nr:ABC transporter ATP-binding protein [Pseudogracilibacillus sp.]